jgi:hypothetical protein
MPQSGAPTLWAGRCSSSAPGAQCATLMPNIIWCGNAHRTKYHNVGAVIDDFLP